MCFKTDDDWLLYAECSLFLDGFAMPEKLTKSTVRKMTRLFLRNKVALIELWAETKLASSKNRNEFVPVSTTFLDDSGHKGLSDQILSCQFLDLHCNKTVSVHPNWHC